MSSSVAARRCRRTHADDSRSRPAVEWVIRHDRNSATSPLLQAGSRVGGRFVVEALLGEGSVSAVYRVRDERSGEHVALKQLRVPAGLDVAAPGSRFEREYHTLRQLAHPHIVAVHDYGVQHGQAYYTMQLLQGADVQALGPQSWQRASQLLYDVASALALLHSRALLHRDISLRNVRCSEHARATLFDFGALAPMHAHSPLIGTPPFVPPEAFELQALDARADLYGLGALGYWLLTGAHAYRARSMRALRDEWLKLPLAPMKAVPGVPAALSGLVMQLLRLERAARPSTAAEVLDRLGAIASLTPEDVPAVGRAYLVTPALVGRATELAELRAAMVRAERGRLGASFVIEGEPGSGRSRLLDAGVLEATLQSALVLRADGAQAAGQSYGLARVLCEQLRREAPELWLDAPSAQALLQAPSVGGESDLAASSERAQRQIALRDCFAACARRRTISIAVDDLEAADEPSLAWLASLCDVATQLPLTLLLTRRSGPAQGAAQVALCALSRVLPLSPLPPQQTELLLRSIFGDVEHLHVLADAAQRVAQGSPRLTMALCEWLVESGAARHSAGQWRLPAQLSQQLPASLNAALLSRVGALPAAACELAETLALTEPLALAVETYPLLGQDGDHGRIYRALDALLCAGILVAAGERFRFVHEGVRQLLVARIDDARKRVLHGRLVAALTACDHPRLPWELLQSGHTQAAIELTLRRPQASDPTQLQLLERLVAAAEALKLPLCMRLQLRTRLVSVAAELGDLARFEAHAPWLLARFEYDSGLRDAGGQAGGEQQAKALAQAEQRHAQASADERGLSPAESLESLLELCMAHVQMTALAQDIELLERLPCLRPWSQVSPAASVMNDIVEIQIAMMAGRYDEAIETSLAVLQRVEQPDRAGLDAASAQRAWRGQRYLQGLMAAVIGDARARHWIAELELLPGHRTHAWRVRMVFELMHGRLEAASECRQQAELLNALDGGGVHFPGLTVRLELLVHMYRGDLLAVKRIAEQVEQFALIYPRWQPTVWIARNYHRVLQGDHAGSLDALERALRLVAPGRHFDWGFAAVSQVYALVRLGRHEHALQQGLEYLEVCRAQRLQRTYGGMLAPIVEALLALHRADEALPLICEQVAWYEGLGTGGFLLASAFELRARVALALDDYTGAQQFAELCARACGSSEAPLVRALFQRLEAHVG